MEKIHLIQENILKTSYIKALLVYYMKLRIKMR